MYYKNKNKHNAEFNFKRVFAHCIGEKIFLEGKV